MAVKLSLLYFSVYSRVVSLRGARSKGGLDALTPALIFISLPLYGLPRRLLSCCLDGEDEAITQGVLSHHKTLRSS